MQSAKKKWEGYDAEGKKRGLSARELGRLRV